MLSGLSTQYELWNYITFMTVYMHLLLSNAQESLIQTSNSIRLFVKHLMVCTEPANNTLEFSLLWY